MITALLMTLMGSVSVSAQETEQIDHSDAILASAEKLDSLYNYWNDFVAQHPKDERAWRNLFEVSNSMVEQKHWKNWQEGEDLKKELNVVGRMKQAIPHTYTFYYSAYEGAYREENWTSDEFFAFRDAVADSAISTLPKDAAQDDYNRWAHVLIMRNDTVRLTDLLTKYYQSGLFSPEALQYHFNELQGMEEGGVYIGAHEGDVLGKLILQLVKGVHRDKILYDENVAVWPEYIEAVFKRIGLDFNETIWQQLHSSYQEESYPAIFRHICANSKRPVYVSAPSVASINLMEGIPAELKPCFYNEGLTLRYSPKPYDNMAVKRRNIESRYWLEYLRMSFEPESEHRRFAAPNTFCRMNYLELLKDQLPYYKEHDQQRYVWLQDLMTAIRQQMSRDYPMDLFDEEDK